MKEEFSPEQNQLKYKRDGKDLLDKWAEIDPKLTIHFCIQNVQKMSLRYDSNADKAQNRADILKSIDYLERAIKVCNDEILRQNLVNLKINIEDGNFYYAHLYCPNLLKWAKRRDTGLKDKNGTSIFEGDYIEYTAHQRYSLYDFTAEVIWIESHACFGYITNDTYTQFADIDELQEDFLNHVEVVF